MATSPRGSLQQHGLTMKPSGIGDLLSFSIVNRDIPDAIARGARYDPGASLSRGRCPDRAAGRQPSPVSGESMASGGCACGRASRHQPHRGTPPTLPALQREVATDPRWLVTAASGPGAPSSPGPHPNRAGGVDQPGPWGRWPTRRCAAEQHLTTDLPENASGAAGVTANGDLRRRKRPRGPPSRGRSSSTYQQERLAACSRYIDSPFPRRGSLGLQAGEETPLPPFGVAARH
jgi:hypothetical protein